MVANWLFMSRRFAGYLLQNCKKTENLAPFKHLIFSANYLPEMVVKWHPYTYKWHSFAISLFLVSYILDNVPLIYFFHFFAIIKDKKKCFRDFLTFNMSL